jgi:Bifunctional DNA primase/polymerase, N-terminal
MGPGPYAEHADRLLERGYAPLPIPPGSKKPGYYVAGMWIGLANWQKRFNSGVPSDIERRRWAANGAGVGVLGGYRGLVGVDIDTDDEIAETILAVLPSSPVRTRGARGQTLFFHGPGIRSQSFDINGRRICDLIAAGRQTVLPPTIHPGTGKPYQWTGIESLEDLEPEDLPELQFDIAERIGAALGPFGWRAEPAPHAGADGDAETPFRSLNDTALARLDAWVPALNLCRCRRARGGYEAVPAWRPSTTGRLVDKRHLNLKIITGPTRFFSLSAIERHLVAQPLSLCLLDEIGAFLANVTSGRASSHEAGISQILRTLWGASFATVETTHRATEAGRIFGRVGRLVVSVAGPTGRSPCCLDRALVRIRRPAQSSLARAPHAAPATGRRSFPRPCRRSPSPDIPSCAPSRTSPRSPPQSADDAGTAGWRPCAGGGRSHCGSSDDRAWRGLRRASDQARLKAASAVIGPSSPRRWLPAASTGRSWWWRRSIG